jgi:hypothetical protein
VTPQSELKTYQNNEINVNTEIGVVTEFYLTHTNESAVEFSFKPVYGYKDYYLVSIAKASTPAKNINSMFLDAANDDDLKLSFDQLENNQDYLITFITVANNTMVSSEPFPVSTGKPYIMSILAENVYESGFSLAWNVTDPTPGGKYYVEVANLDSLDAPTVMF